MSKIEWTGETWNCVVGCSVHSPGCQKCYAMKMAARLERMGQKQYAGLTQPSKAGPVWTGEVRFVDEALLKPLHKKKPTTYFVCSMADLFHEEVPDYWIIRIFAVMKLTPHHTYQILTKRSGRMRVLLSDPSFWSGVDDKCMSYWRPGLPTKGMKGGPLPNVWCGVSAEDQRRYDERKDDLRNTPAAVRFFSLEPLIGPIVGDYFGDWAIVGGESGHGARRLFTPWVRHIVGMAKSAGSAVFVKQLGAHCEDIGFARWPSSTDWDDVDASGTIRIRLRDRKGGDMSEWPDDLRIREMPAQGRRDAA